MTKADEPSRNESGNPPPVTEDRQVDLTPFEFLSMRLRGDAPGPAQSASDDSSDSTSTERKGND